MGTGEEKKVAKDERGELYLACYSLALEYLALGDLISNFIKTIEA